MVLTLNDNEHVERAADPLSRLHEELSRLTHEAAVPGLRRYPQAAIIDPHHQPVSRNRISLGGWPVRGFIGILLAAGIGLGGIIWLGSSGDAAKTTPPAPTPIRPALVVQAAPIAAGSPELTPLLQSMARDLASLGKEVEQLRADRDLIVRENGKLGEQFRASQEQLTRATSLLSEQLKASQELLARDNANVVGQIKGVQDQLTSVVSLVSQQNAPPKIAVARPRLAAPAVPKPIPTLSTPEAANQPKPEKPKLSSASRPPAPAR